MNGILTNISAVKSHYSDDGSNLNLRTAFIQDKTGRCKITIFSKIPETLQENVHYLINHVYLDKYKYSRILKTSEVSTIKRTDEDLDFDITTRAMESPVENIECKFVTIDTKTTAKKIHCSDCKQEITADEDGIVVCKNCAIMTCTNQCRVDDKILCTIAILDQNNRKRQVSIAQDVPGKLLTVSMKDNINFLKQFMAKKFKATLNTRDQNYLPFRAARLWSS